MKRHCQHENSMYYKNDKYTAVLQQITTGMKNSLMIAGLLLAMACTAFAQPGAETTQFAAGEANWKYFLSPNGGFQVEFPKHPDLRRKTIPDQFPEPVVLYSVQAPYDSMAFLVTFADFPKEYAERNGGADLMNTAIGGAISMAQVEKGALKAYDVIMKHTIGKEVQVNLTEEHVPGGGSMRARFFVIGARLYQVALIGPRDRAFSEEFNRFFNSFELTDKSDGETGDAQILNEETVSSQE